MTVRRGTKLEPDDVHKLQRESMGTLVSTQEAEAEGQSWQEPVQCPWCNTIGIVRRNSEGDTWVTCGTCGNPFEV